MSSTLVAIQACSLVFFNQTSGSKVMSYALRKFEPRQYAAQGVTEIDDQQSVRHYCRKAFRFTDYKMCLRFAPAMRVKLRQYI
jgi:hypothetical protein